MRLLPSRLLPGLVRTVPQLHVGLPEGRRLRINYYLDDFTVDIDTTYVIERAMLSGRYDPQTLSIINQMVRPGDFCMDIGANVGAIAFAIAKRTGTAGRILAFEPGALTFKRFSANLALNPAYRDTIVPIQAGLSDKEGTLFWHEHGNNRGNANLSGDAQGDGVQVPVTTVDKYFLDHPAQRLDFVKIDVESMEYEVIKGGLETWKKFKPVLYYETLADFEKFRGIPVFRLIEEMLKPIGYSFYKVEGRGTLRPAAYPDLSANTLAVPPHRSIPDAH